MHSPRVYVNNIGSICTDSLRHGNGLSALLLLTRAAKSSAAKSSASKTRSMESRLYLNLFSCMRSFNHSTSAHVKKSMHIGAKLLLLEHFERDKITKRSRDL